MFDNNRNLIVAVLLSAAVLFAWQYFVAAPQMKAEQAHQAALAHKEKPHAVTTAAPSTVAGGAVAAAHMTREQALKAGGARVAIDTPSVDGSILLKGARFDDLRLKCYHENAGTGEGCGAHDPKNPEIILFSPANTSFPYYAVFGWVVPPGSGVKVPDDDTVWKASAGAVLTPATPLTLTWDNGHGLVFSRTIAVDAKFMFTVKDSVANKTGSTVTLYPYAYVARVGVPVTQHFWALHEGFVGIANGTLTDPSYTDFKDGAPPVTFQSTGGWAGITDKYWMASVIPPQNEPFNGSYTVAPDGGTKSYQADYRLNGRTIAPGATTTIDQRLFAGTKDVQLLRDYEKQGVEQFHMAVDWGWFWFFTQPIFWLLDLFYKFFGNFGIAIILLTVSIKLVFFPLADTSYRSMSKMKKLQPQMESIKERFADDKVQQQQEIMALYKREKINPVSGCLPMLIQVPVFFSLYKVLLVTIEMRHAPLFHGAWIQDLSAPDPTTFWNFFGLFPWHAPSFIPAYLSIGILPIIMGFSQFITTKLNPAPADPVQAKMFTYMPLIFTFMMASFPAGLVLYWTCNNLLSALQQYVMMKRQGVEVHLFNNLKIPALTRLLSKPDSKPAGE
ncbi:MAG TPA: membrane protein insertase YidC [Rhizomicrobium sp.]|nr:membrane protein insertase YidC [Rhizomicrobium sp.]